MKKGVKVVNNIIISASAAMIAVLVISSFFGSCKKDEKKVTLPTITTKVIINITSTSATSGGIITNEGGNAVFIRGVCWDTLTNPSQGGMVHCPLETTGTFPEYTLILTGLSPNTKYYVRAYGINSAGTGYGSEVSFTTLH